MKILVVSDQECKALWDYYTPGKLKEYDLMISCGDLKASYLSFLVTMGRAPLLYVHGNHDTAYVKEAPEGCDNIDGCLVTYNGIRILGLGGCRKYHPGNHQYTEKEMRHRIRKLRFALWRQKGVDIVITHAPPAGVGDAEDPAHWGFEAFLPLLEKYKPRYLFHGHVHTSYGQNVVREKQYAETQVINACERYVIEIPDVPVASKHRDKVIYRSRHKEPEDFTLF